MDCVTGTAQRLREATEQLLLEQGQRRTTLRDITERAEANVAAVNYHFGSKDALISEVFEAVLTEATDGQRVRLGQLPDDAPLRSVVRSWLAPALPGAISAREERLWALIQRGVVERAPGLMAHVHAVQADNQSVLVDRLSGLLPHLSEPEIAFRLAAVMAAVAALGSAPLPMSPMGDATAGSAASADMLLDWVVAGFEGA